MELKFVETIEGKEWEAEFEAPSDFNLHLERVNGGSLVVSQRGTPSGEYAAAFAKGMYEGQAVIDYDFGALVYPKYIKVVSGNEVVNASVNFNEGGGSGSGSGDSDFALYYQTELGSSNNLGIVSGAMIMKGFPCVMKMITDTACAYGTPHTFNPMTSITSGTVQIQFIRVHTAVDETFAMYPFYTDNEIKSALGGLLDALTPITKEQFYNLEA